MSHEEIESGALKVKPKPNTEIMAELRAGHWSYDPGQGLLAPWRYEHDDDKGKGDFGKGKDYFGKSNDDYGEGKGHFGNGKGKDRVVVCLCPDLSPIYGTTGDIRTRMPSANLSDDFQIVYYGKGKGKGKGKDDFGKGKDEHDIEEEPPLPIPPPPPLPKALKALRLPNCPKISRYLRIMLSLVL